MNKINLQYGIILIIVIFVFSHYKLSAQHFNGIYKVTDNGTLFSLVNDTVSLRVDTVPLVSASEFNSVKKKYDKVINQFELLITLNENAAENFAKITEENIGKQLAFIIDDKLLTAPIVQKKITGGKLSVTGLDKKLVTEIEKYFRKSKK